MHKIGWGYRHDDELFVRNRAAALKRSKTILVAVLFGATICSLLLFAFSFRSEAYIRMRHAYVALTTLYILLLPISRRAQENAILPLIYALHGVFVLFCTYTSAFVWPNDVCVMILSELFIFPTLILDKGWRVTIVTIASAIAYLAVIRFFNSASVYHDEFINVTCFTLMSCIVGTFTRRTQLVNFDTAEQLRIGKEFYQLAIKHSGIVICDYDVSARRITITPEISATFHTPREACDVPYAPVREGIVSAETSNDYIRFFERILHGENAGAAEFEFLTSNGWRWQKASFSTVFSSDGRPVSAVVSFVDITEQHTKEARQKALAETDGLTGILNRATTERLISQKLRISSSLSAFALIDLDNLKTINDELGHPSGDEALRLLANTLRDRFRQTDIIGRVGGDEFVLFLIDASLRSDVEKVMNDLIERLSTLRIGEGNDRPLSASIGVAFSPADGRTFDELYSAADKALYTAKRRGKGRYAFHNEPSSQAADNVRSETTDSARGR